MALVSFTSAGIVAHMNHQTLLVRMPGCMLRLVASPFSTITNAREFAANRGFMRALASGFMATICSLPWGAASTLADTVEIRGGGQLSGSLKRLDVEKTPFVVVELDDKIRVAVPASQVGHVAAEENLAEYRQQAAKVGEDADQHYELARWCKEKLLLAQNKHHLQRTISLDPNHAKARAALGFVEQDGKWIRYSQQQRSRGLIPVSGKYRLPEEVALMESRDAVNLDSKRWSREIAKLRAAYMRGGDKGGEALMTLQAIRDPLAAYAIADELIKGAASQPQALRMMWVDQLTMFANRPAMEALVRVGLDDPNAAVREHALEALQKISPATAIANYLPRLKSNDNEVVKRAARALSYFPDPEIALALVDALITEHKTVIPASSNTNAGFGGDGSQGLSYGSKAQVRVDKIENPLVLSLLQQIEPDVNYGYNELRWRMHFAARLSSYQGDMRRDP